MISSITAPALSAEVFLSIAALFISLISILYTFLSDRKVRKLEIIEEATHNILINEFPILLTKMLMIRKDEKVIEVLDFLDRSKNKIVFLKYYDGRKYSKASVCFQELEDEISLFGNNVDKYSSSRIESLTKKLIKILHK